MKVEAKSFLKEVLFPYMVYTMFFLGIGMLSGSIVHMPLNPVRYSIILSLGIIVFIVASFLNETKIDKKNLTFKDVIRLVLFSLTLSIGIGMISGGIQHFDEEAKYAAKLIPIGTVISLLSFIIKNKISLNPRRIVLLVITLFILALPLYYVLNAIANTIPVSENGHPHADGEEHEESSKHEDEKTSITEQKGDEVDLQKSPKDITIGEKNVNEISLTPKPTSKGSTKNTHTHSSGNTNPHTD